MDITTLCRLVLIYVHLLLCVFALHTVLQTDLKVLRGQIDASALLTTHRHLMWLLGGLWATGLVIAAIDLGYDPVLVFERPKLIAKLGSVIGLTVNGFMLRYWCFPRLAQSDRLSVAEHSVLLAIGAISTASWMMAAFFGIARPLQQLSIAACLALYGVALTIALLAAVALGMCQRHGRTSNGGVSRASL